ncbi:hypothetical protein DUI87_11067 [Hirundo rustica rustica]|uniref:Uncharacterized protein n=1 Tax=Hirundo rustica rustica TaxID=333673 RepID=A0A3M0KFF5_HIRRU|nr:hypothetical protein DUI87_11067 [Hirundo rustica rustica]
MPEVNYGFPDVLRGGKPQALGGFLLSLFLAITRGEERQTVEDGNCDTMACIPQNGSVDACDLTEVLLPSNSMSELERKESPVCSLKQLAIQLMVLLNSPPIFFVDSLASTSLDTAKPKY